MDPSLFQGDYGGEARFALQVLRQAGLLAQRIQEQAGRTGTKLDRSPVTVADFAVQAYVGARLEQVYPGMSLVAEETSRMLGEEGGGQLLGQVLSAVRSLIPQAEAGEVCRWIDLGAGDAGQRYWVLDPVDGTKGFLRAGQYAVALALVQDGRVAIGGLACPNLALPDLGLPGGRGVLALAVRGRGAWAESLKDPAGFVPLHVSRCHAPREARLLHSYEMSHTDPALLERWIDSLGLGAHRLPMDSQAKYALLAAGAGELMIRLPSAMRPPGSEYVWDHAAGALLVMEAGGRVSDLLGRPLDFSAGRKLTHNVGVLASNGRLHQAALEALEGLGAFERWGRS
jgi:3'(2'), 5'-bisphosphate nucleotidase